MLARLWQSTSFRRSDGKALVATDRPLRTTLYLRFLVYGIFMKRAVSTLFILPNVLHIKCSSICAIGVMEILPEECFIGINVK